MFIIFEDRPSDSPFVERIWRCHSERAGSFLSIAASHWEMVVTRHLGKTTLTVRGPETKATMADCPAEGVWIGIRFKLGTFMPQLPVRDIRDRKDVNLPEASGHSFWLNGSAWEYPDFENAETFVSQLAHDGLIAHDLPVSAALQGQLKDLSLRSAQRHFLQATGMTHSAFRQIERARLATNLLRQGVSILDTVHEAGYFDQAHLTRSLKYLIGQTPAKIARGDQQWADYWPTSTAEPFASHINKAPKFVVSKTLDSAPWGAWDNAMLVRDSLADTITTLKRQPGKNIGIHGSPTLIEAMLHADLLDELRLEIYPVVAGSGLRLFQDGRGIKQLQLATSKITSNGVVILTYQMANAGRLQAS